MDFNGFFYNHNIMDFFQISSYFLYVILDAEHSFKANNKTSRMTICYMHRKYFYNKFHRIRVKMLSFVHLTLDSTRWNTSLFVGNSCKNLYFCVFDASLSLQNLLMRGMDLWIINSLSDGRWWKKSTKCGICMTTLFLCHIMLKPFC